MRRLILSLVGLLLLLLAFYGAWPALSLKRIDTALKGGDAEVLAAKIEFDSVRESLRPFATAEAGKALDKLDEGSGLGNIIGGELKGQLQQKAVDAILKSVVTPEGAIRMYREGKSLHEMLKRNNAGNGQGNVDIGKVLGTLFGKKPGAAPAADTPAAPPAAPAPATEAAAPKHCCGLSNVKGWGFAGWRTIWVNLARDNEAKEGDARVEMSFTGADWKVTAVRPRI